MVLITIVNGVYKPTYNWGAPPCRDSHGHDVWPPMAWDGGLQTTNLLRHVGYPSEAWIDFFDPWPFHVPRNKDGSVSITWPFNRKTYDGLLDLGAHTCRQTQMFFHRFSGSMCFMRRTCCCWLVVLQILLIPVSIPNNGMIGAQRLSCFRPQSPKRSWTVNINLVVNRCQQIPDPILVI